MFFWFEDDKTYQNILTFQYMILMENDLETWQKYAGAFETDYQMFIFLVKI